MFTYPLKAALLTCIFFSIYFITQVLSFLLSFNKKHPVLSYLICILIVMGQFIPAILFSMRATPFWFAYLINTVVLIVFQLLLIQTLFQKKSSNRYPFLKIYKLFCSFAPSWNNSLH